MRIRTQKVLLPDGTIKEIQVKCWTLGEEKEIGQALHNLLNEVEQALPAEDPEPDPIQVPFDDDTVIE